MHTLSSCTSVAASSFCVASSMKNSAGWSAFIHILQSCSFSGNSTPTGNGGLCWSLTCGRIMSSSSFWFWRGGLCFVDAVDLVFVLIGDVGESWWSVSCPANLWCLCAFRRFAIWFSRSRWCRCCLVFLVVRLLSSSSSLLQAWSNIRSVSSNSFDCTSDWRCFRRIASKSTHSSYWPCSYNWAHTKKVTIWSIEINVRCKYYSKNVVIKISLLNSITWLT